MSNFRLILLIPLIFSLSLLGCKDQIHEVEPEDVALQFFDAVYNKKDVSTARSLVDSKLVELIDHYQNISNIQRHIVGMKMPGQPVISVEVQNTTADFFRRFEKTEVTVEVRFSSEVDGKKYYDNRSITLVKNGINSWIITEIHGDPFLTNG